VPDAFLLDRHHHLGEGAGRSVVPRLPEVGYPGRAVRRQQLSHPLDVVVVRVGGHDERTHLLITAGRGDQPFGGKALEEDRQLPCRPGVDHDDAPALGLRPCWQEQELGVTVAHVEQEVEHGGVVGSDGVHDAARLLQSPRRQAPADR
jgi:hypothetical protein